VRGHSFLPALLPANPVVLDVGANHGAFTTALVDEFGAVVTAVEPNPALTPDLAASGAAVVLGMALADAVGTVRLAVHENDECSTTMPAADVDRAGTVEVDAAPLAMMIEAASPDRVDLVKLDVEGAEVAALASVDPTCLHRVVQLTVEFHDSQGLTSPQVVRGIRRTLRRRGFASIRMSVRHRADVLFVRRALLTRRELWLIRWVERPRHIVKRAVQQLRHSRAAADPSQITHRRTANDAIDFARRARSRYQARARSGPHHPHAVYTPRAFRHYHRREVLLGALRPLVFKNALDVGCSDGYFAEAVSREFGVPVTGVDLALTAVRRATGRGSAGVVADGTVLPFASRSVDLVFCTETLEHVFDEQALAAELLRVARKWVVVTTPVGGRGRPDWEITREGHVHAFTRESLRELFGPDATISSYRLNTTFGLYRVMGRWLGRRVGKGFIRTDLELATRIGSDSARLAPIRHRSFLVVAPVLSVGRLDLQGRPQVRPSATHSG
jgi:FkbM family methyltransferase